MKVLTEQSVAVALVLAGIATVGLWYWTQESRVLEAGVGFFSVAAALLVRTQLRVRSLKRRLAEHRWQICTECQGPLVEGALYWKCSKCEKEFEKREAPREWRGVLARLGQLEFVRGAKSME